MAALNREAIVETIKDFIVREFLPGEDAGALKESIPLYGSGILDSISTLKLVSFIEETFSILIEAHEASARFGSVGEIADLVEEKL
jgi:acyl carrier protein